jgi:hypothetical protein
MDCTKEIIGVQTIAFYTNKDVIFNYPDITNEKEIDLISYSGGAYVVDEVIEFPKWERKIVKSGNYKGKFIDNFSFQLNGIKNSMPAIIKEMRNNRLGFITEIITTANNSYVFPIPVFLDQKNTKRIDSHSWNVSLSYRVPTFKDKLTKLNNLIMIYDYILGGDDSIIAGGTESIVIG